MVKSLSVKLPLSRLSHGALLKKTLMNMKKDSMNLFNSIVMEDLEKLKSEGWIEYRPKLSFKVLDKSDNIVEQPKTIHLYKVDGKVLSIKSFTSAPPNPFPTTLPFK